MAAGRQAIVCSHTYHHDLMYRVNPMESRVGWVVIGKRHDDIFRALAAAAWIDGNDKPLRHKGAQMFGSKQVFLVGNLVEFVSREDGHAALFFQLHYVGNFLIEGVAHNDAQLQIVAQRDVRRQRDTRDVQSPSFLSLALLLQFFQHVGRDGARVDPV